MDKIKSIFKKKGSGDQPTEPPNSNNTAASSPAPSVAPVFAGNGIEKDKLPVMAKDVELPELEQDPIKIKLIDILLSPAASTESKDDENGEKADLKELSDAEIVELLKKYVSGIESMYDRTGGLLLTQMFPMTYKNGLPIYKNNVAVQQHTIHAMKHIFDEIAHGDRPESTKKKVLHRMSDAFKSCQAEQGRVIDAVFGMLTGRDKSLKQQVLMVVDVQKELVLENLVNTLNPDAWKVSDDFPQKQVPHITSSYRVAVGTQLGLRGVANAMLDHCGHVVEAKDAERIVDGFRRMFKIDELCDTLVSDVNQQGADDDRLIDRDVLGKWAGNSDENNGFDSHSIFYDEENKEAYKDLGAPSEENMFQPFLNRTVALNVLKALFL